MNVKTNSELQRILADRSKKESLSAVAKSLGIAEVYAFQIIEGRRKISRQVAARMGYKMVRIPQERVFEPLK